MRVVLLDDFHPVISDSLANWNWNILDGKNWSVEDFKKNASTNTTVDRVVNTIASYVDLQCTCIILRYGTTIRS